MIDAIINLSVRHKAFVFLATAVGCLCGYWCLSTMRLDAIPDLGETQVIIYSHWDRSADLMESQVTYPIITSLLGTPHIKSVRGVSDFGSSYIYVVFDDDTDIYWARSRTLEYLSAVRSKLPEGVQTEIGPDATSLGWIFQYVITDPTGQNNLADLRTFQDWHLRNYLKSVPGVADVVPLGGFTRQCQVTLNPELLERYGVSILQVIAAIRSGNEDTSGRSIDFGGTEYIVRGHGEATSLDDFRKTVVSTPADGAPIRIADLGNVAWGPDLRRGVADLDGKGDLVSGIVIMRNGENALKVIDRVKQRLREIEPGLPSGVKIVPIYDRSDLIHRTIGSVEWTIVAVVLTVVIIILVFLWHFPSAVIPLITMPAAVLMAFIPLRLMGISANVMSLAGIAIAFGELIDASIVIVEQTHKRLEQWERAGCPGPRTDVVLAAVKEVAGPTFFALLVIAVSLLPVLTLQAQEGRMFRPLAYAKSFAMIFAALLALTLDPALRLLLARVKRFHLRPAPVARLLNAMFLGRIRQEDKHPISSFLTRIYEPVVARTLRFKWVVLTGAAILILVTIPVYLSLGSEYMPPMDEGAILYMPTSMPGMSITEAQHVMEASDSVLMQFPEVDHVLGKAGRADSATDPAPLSMFETLITLKPRAQWRPIPTWYTSWTPHWSRAILRHVTPDTISPQELVREMDSALKIPGVSNAWTMPIKGRIEMLTSGIRTPVGLKIYGSDPQKIEELGQQVQAVLPAVPGTRSVYAEHPGTGYYIDVNWRRDQLARYGISIQQAQQVVNSAIGGDLVTTIISGPERFPVNVRLMSDFRNNLEALKHIVVSPNGQNQTPLSELADLEIRQGPAMIRDENAMITGYIYVDLTGRDAGTYISDANKLLRDKIAIPPGYSITWSGEFEGMQRVKQRLRIVIPITLAVVMLLIYLSTRSFTKTLIVLLAVPFSAVGAIWLLYLLHYNLSVAVWVGLIGLLSIDAETGVFMLLYLDLAYEDAKHRDRLRSIHELRDAITYGAARRLRPKVMTFATTCLGLLPVMWSIGAGADVVKRIAAPMVGGIFTSFLLELLVFPALYELWRRNSIPQQKSNDQHFSSTESTQLEQLISGD